MRKYLQVHRQSRYRQGRCRKLTRRMPLAENLRGQLVAGDIRSPILRGNRAADSHNMTVEELCEFEREVATAFEAKQIRAPIHLSGGNEEELIKLFRGSIPHSDWIFSTYRSHYHALLHGIPREKVMAQILAGRSMNLTFPAHRFCTSAMVGGILSIATGVALALKRRKDTTRNVWCFIGDMAASTSAFH